MIAFTCSATRVVCETKNESRTGVIVLCAVADRNHWRGSSCRAAASVVDLRFHPFGHLADPMRGGSCPGKHGARRLRSGIGLVGDSGIAAGHVRDSTRSVHVVAWPRSFDRHRIAVLESWRVANERASIR